jgi:hypothetical protein
MTVGRCRYTTPSIVSAKPGLVVTYLPPLASPLLQRKIKELKRKTQLLKEPATEEMVLLSRE